MKCLEAEPGGTLFVLDVSLLLLLLLLQLEAVLCTVLGLCLKVCPAEVIRFWRGSRNCTVFENSRAVYLHIKAMREAALTVLSLKEP